MQKNALPTDAAAASVFRPGVSRDKPRLQVPPQAPVRRFDRSGRHTTWARGAWLVTIILALAACTPGRSSRSGKSGAAAAAESLTNALEFNNPGAKRIEGEFPASTSGAVDKGGADLGPGGAASIDLDAPDDIAATLVWMDGSSSFWSLPVGGADRTGSTVRNTFTVSADVCDDLCNIVHQVKCYEAAQTADGTITKANLTTVLLQCTGSGDPAQCQSTSPPSTVDAGSTPSDVGSGADASEPDPPPTGGSYCDELCNAAAVCEGLFEDVPEGSACSSECASKAGEISAACQAAYAGFFKCVGSSGGGSNCGSAAQGCLQQNAAALQAGGCVPDDRP